MKCRLQLLILFLLAGLLLSCGTLDQSTAVGSNALRVGVTPNAPPMIDKKGGRIVGLEASMARDLARELGREVQFVERDWDELIPSLQEGQIDIIMSGMTISQERSLLVAFSDPYLGVGQALLVRSSDLWTYAYPKAIMALTTKIGVEKGTTSDLFVQRYCRNATRVPLSSPERAVRALTSERIDVFLHDSPVIWSLSARNPSEGVAAVPRLLTHETLGWAVRRSNTPLLDQVNGVLRKWKESGRLDSMVRNWIPIPN